VVTVVTVVTVTVVTVETADSCDRGVVPGANPLVVRLSASRATGGRELLSVDLLHTTGQDLP
jgi:hypothetical protein